jgi:DNA mismatch repair protein MutS
MRFLLFRGFRTLANRMFGFYPKVGRARASKVPAECVRQQTVKNAKRYTTPELDDR